MVPVHEYETKGSAVRVTVIKDGGDDPDVTHGEKIQTLVTLLPGDKKLKITLDGGHGVGRATLPGLPIKVGQAAINPAPRAQIIAAALEGAEGFQGAISLLVEVPKGEELATKTMNPRLGIVGGISILGTQGIVKPFSHKAYTASISEALDVAAAAGLSHAVFTTGRRTERLYLESHPDTNPLSAIQVADFFSFANRAATLRGFTDITWSVFFGKLVKQSQGLAYTHAKTHAVDFELLAKRCAEAGMNKSLLHIVRKANTARQVLEMLGGDPVRDALLRLLINHAKAAATLFAKAPVHVHYKVFDFNGDCLA